MISRILKIGDEIKETEVTDVLETIKKSFDENWLNTPGGSNPLQILWQRPDIFSTMELYNFGYSLRTMLNINPNWVKEQIEHAKSDHKNNQRGAIFEIFALGFLNNGDQRVEPAIGNNPGFDGIINLAPNKKLRLSLKSYGLSASEAEFRRYAEEFEDKFVDEIKRRNIHSIQLFIDSYTAFPSPERWKDLISKIPEIVDQYEYGKKKSYEIDGYWSLIILWINDNRAYHKSYSSYYLLITSELHKNEYLNVYSKLNEACDNLEEHHSNEDDTVANLILVHMPPTASIDLCIKYVEQYFLEHPNKAVSGILLYQPSIVSNATYTSKHISHCFMFCQSGTKLADFLSPNLLIDMTIPVGVETNVPSIVQMVPINGGPPLPVGSKYLFQRGHFYVESVQKSLGNITGTVRKIAPGIFEHSVASILGQGTLSFGPRQPLDDTLLIN